MGNFFVGSPAVLKATGVYRLLNNAFEMQMKNHFAASGVRYVKVSDLNDFNYLDYLVKE